MDGFGDVVADDALGTGQVGDGAGDFQHAVSQGDIASLKGEDVDWTNNTVGFTRKKSGVPRACCFRICPPSGPEIGPRSLASAAASLALPAFPCTATVTHGRSVL